MEKKIHHSYNNLELNTKLEHYYCNKIIDHNLLILHLNSKMKSLKKTHKGTLRQIAQKLIISKQF